MLTIEPTLISQVVDINYKVKAIWTGSADTTPSEQEITIKLDAECPQEVGEGCGSEAQSQYDRWIDTDYQSPYRYGG